MRLKHSRTFFRAVLLVFAVAATNCLNSGQPAVAGSGLTIEAGTQEASAKLGQWPAWSFSADLDVGVVHPIAIEVLDSEDCSTAGAGPDMAQPGWYGRLYPAPGPSGLLVLAGSLSPTQDVQGSGSATVVPAHDASPPPLARPADSLTHVNITLQQLGQSIRGDDLSVCIEAG
jgi:hypothetical protein